MNNIRFIKLVSFVNRFAEGYFLCEVTLLKIRATTKRIIAPVNTGDIGYMKPIAFTFSVPMIGSNAVAPPGGCKVFVICIITIESETARGAVIQMMSGRT